MSYDRYTLTTGRASTTFTGSLASVLAHARKLSEFAAAEIGVHDRNGDTVARFLKGEEIEGSRPARPPAPSRSSSDRTPVKARARPAGSRFAVVRVGRVISTDADDGRAREAATAESTTFPEQVVTVYDTRGKIVQSFLAGQTYQGPPPAPVPAEWFDAPKPKKRR